MQKKEIERGFYKRFIQIPGPNPILVSGGPGDWDESVIECADVLKDRHTYYLFYHGVPKDKKKWSRIAYRIGVATAPSPLGPWTKFHGNPILDLGEEGSWEDRHIACPHIIKEGENKYFMWYSASDKDGKWHIGLATASSPLGPWEKYQKNPIIEDFGYVGGVVKFQGRYYLYSAHPVGSTSPDQGPICVATSERPEGPWKKYEGNPVLSPDDWGSWDDGGYSEAKVVYHDGMFHIFYGGTKWKKIERIGYAYSLDGYNFIKYPGNPVALPEREPNAEAYAEVHALFEPPFIYAYHTLRYKNVNTYTEHIGVQILVPETPFKLAIPVVNSLSLKAKDKSSLEVCPAMSLQFISDLALTVECHYQREAKAGLRVHLLGSYDGINYDTEDLDTFDIPLNPGKKVSKTVVINHPSVMFMKIICENRDRSKEVSGIKVTVILGSV